MAEKLLDVKNLSIAFQDDVVVNQISFHINRAETFALVGESGSGKSMTALSILRLLPNNAQMSADDISLSHHQLLTIPEKEFCKIRGKRIGFIFQDPMSSLNPVMTIGEQIAEVIQLHFQLSKKEINYAVIELLQYVEIAKPQKHIDDYPHQLSGGQRQRVIIAIALAGRPDLLIADEPTTALDVTIQAQILKLLKNIQQKTGMALWLISHDLALVSTMADRIAVMQKGKIVETNYTQLFFNHAEHPYSIKLLAALPSMDSCKGKIQSPLKTQKDYLLEVKDLKIYYPVRKGLFKKVVGYIKAVRQVSFTIDKAKTLALVGESGCGKTTLGKGLVHLINTRGGQVLLNKVDILQLSGEELRQKRAEIQIIFQDPFSSMNPRLLISEIIEEGMIALHPEMTATQRQQRVAQLLQQVDLPESAALRYPHEFSGGQRQRICIARALAVEPKLIICDEPTSALDVSVQAQIIQLLKRLQQQQGISYLFITHDLAVVAEIADEVAVMYKGRIIEQGPVEKILFEPTQLYTRKLIKSIPVIRS